MQAIQAHQERLRADGLIDKDTSAFVAMTTGERHGRWDSAGRRFDEFVAADRAGHYGTMHVFHHPPEG